MSKVENMIGDLSAAETAEALKYAILNLPTGLAIRTIAAAIDSADDRAELIATLEDGVGDINEG